MQAITPPVVSVPDSILLQFLADDPENADRIYRAKALVEAGHVERSMIPGLWLVRSASVENGAYRIMNGLCHCPDTARVGGQHCKHAISCRIFRAVERADAEQSDPMLADADTYYCVLCEEPIPAAEVVETRWGFMHERCAATEPPADPDAMIDLELTGRAMLTLVPTAALPLAEGGCTRLPMNARARALYNELYPDDDSAA